MCKIEAVTSDICTFFTCCVVFFCVQTKNFAFYLISLYFFSLQVDKTYQRCTQNKFLAQTTFCEEFYRFTHSHFDKYATNRNIFSFIKQRHIFTSFRLCIINSRIFRHGLVGIVLTRIQLDAFQIIGFRWRIARCPWYWLRLQFRHSECTSGQWYGVTWDTNLLRKYIHLSKIDEYSSAVIIV